MGVGIEDVLARALRDRAFAELLRSEPNRALAGYALSDQERAAVVRASAEDPQQSTLDERPSTASRLI